MIQNKDAYQYIGDDEYLVYVRVSTDRDEQVSSVENQIAICRYWLEQNGFKWREEAVCKDEGISGTVLVEREAMQYILEQARQKKIKMVVFKSLSRLARDIKDALDIRDTLHEHNVRIISIEEGLDSMTVSKNDMRFEMSSLFNEQYSRMLSVNIAGVLAQKVRQGGHIGKVPFGYVRVRDAERQVSRLQIKEDEARIIRQIFAWRVHGYGYKMITYMLNNPARRIPTQPMYIDLDEEIPSPTGKKWQMTTVQRIVQNPTYCGDFILNQYRKEKIRGRRKQIRNPKDKWTIFRDHHPAIVSRDVWEKANDTYAPHRGRRITPWNEFRGIVKCAECGSNMVIVQSYKHKKDGSRTEWAYLKCSRYRRGGKDLCVNHDPIQYHEFRQAIIDRLIELSNSMTFDFESQHEKLFESRVKALENSLEQLEQRKKNLLDLYLDQLIDKSEFEQKRHEIEQEIVRTREKLKTMSVRENAEKQVRNIQEAFEALKNQDQDLHHVFTTLIERIDIHPDGSLDIRYHFENISSNVLQ